MTSGAIFESRPQHMESQERMSSVSEEVAMSIKRTFIEFAFKSPKAARLRSVTDSEMVIVGEGLLSQDLSDASTDTPSDHEDVGTATELEDWASPCLGPAGDLFYSSIMPCDLEPLPAALPLPHHESNIVGPCQEIRTYNSSMWIDDMSFLHSHAQAQLDAWPFGFAHEAGESLNMSASSSASVKSAPALCTHEGSTSPLKAEEPKTTVMLRNLPKFYTRITVIEMLEVEGFEGSYDIVYVPVDFTSHISLGYAFVNFLSENDADRCWTVFNGFSDWFVPCEHVCEVVWSDPHQGTDALVERYRNSPVMHDSMPEEWKPAFFVGGVQVAFPKPTVTIKAPKQKKPRSKRS